MRKISVFAVSCAAVLLLSACGSSSSSVPASSGASSAVSSSSEPVSSVSVSSSASVDDAFSDFEAALSENGIAYTEKVRMAAELIGGVNGYKYKTPDYNIEVYTFDPSSDAYLTAPLSWKALAHSLLMLTKAWFSCRPTTFPRK